MTRAEASRNNSRKSCGPKTPEGKRIASMNAVTHGLRALTPALTNEDREGLERLVGCAVVRAVGFRANIPVFKPPLVFEPAAVSRRRNRSWRTKPRRVARVTSDDLHEQELVTQMALAKWRERRAIFLETALYDLQMDLQIEDVRRRFEGEIDEPTRAAIAFRALVGPNDPLITVHRIEMDYVRLHRLSHKRLLEHQAQRLNSPDPPDPSAAPAPGAPPNSEPRTPNSEPVAANSEPHAACLNPFLPLAASTSSPGTPSPANPVASPESATRVEAGTLQNSERRTPNFEPAAPNSEPLSNIPELRTPNAEPACPPRTPNR